MNPLQILRHRHRIGQVKEPFEVLRGTERQ